MVSLQMTWEGSAVKVQQGICMSRRSCTCCILIITEFASSATCNFRMRGFLHCCSLCFVPWADPRELCICVPSVRCALPQANDGYAFVEAAPWLKQVKEAVNGIV